MERHSCPLNEDDIKKIKDDTLNRNVILNMQEDIHSLQADIKQIKDALLGDGYNPGFKQRIERVETETERNTVAVVNIKNWGSAAFAIVGILGTIFTILSKSGII
jgi:hypothetical protein